MGKSKGKISKFVAKKRDNAATMRKMKIERLAYEWAVTGGDKSVRNWLMEVKGYTDPMYDAALLTMGSSEWYVIRKQVQDKLTHSLVKSHVDFVADMNDTHIKAAKLGLAKAIDMMTRMKIEERKDKKGNTFFSGFRPSDLHKCLESIRAAQHIQRRALGLPNDEGSITTWQKIQHDRKDELIVSAADGSVVTKSSTITTTVEGATTLESALSYDDIKLLIESERRRKKEEGEKTIEAVRVDPEMR